MTTDSNTTSTGTTDGATEVSGAGTPALGVGAHSVIVHDDYDARAYAETQHLYPRLVEAVAAASARLPTAPALVEDLFYSLYRPAPSLRPVEELAPSATINRAIVEQMMGTTEWGSIRSAGTVGDQLYSAIATATVARGVLGSLEKKTIARLRELHDAEAAAATLFGQAEALEDLAAEKEGDRAQALYEQAREARVQAERRQHRAEDLAARLEEGAEGIEDATRRAARDALAQAEGEIEATAAAVKTFAGGYGAEGARGAGTTSAPVLTLKEKMELATTVGQSARLKQIAELTGRMTRIALQVQKSKITHPPDEVVGIAIGDDLAKMLPVETALLSDPTLEDQFFLKYAEKRLMQLDMSGSERQGRGPLIVALDSSGSMTDALGGGLSKEAWSKAVLLALLAIARKQKRDLAALHFSNAGQLKVYQFPKGEAAPTALIATTEWFYGNGTAYDGWMAEALRLVESSRFDRADVVCVSDGEVSIDSRLEADWNRRRKARGMRCYSVLLGDHAGAMELARVSDALATIDNLTDDNAALRMVFGV